MTNLVNLPSQHIMFLTQIYLGLGEQNIVDITYCISRVRIQVKNIDQICSDSYFLDLGINGIIRDNDSVHLLFGKTSSVLANQLIALYHSVTHDCVSLLELCGGISAISSHLVQEDSLHLTLSEISSPLKTDIQHFSSSRNIPVIVKENTIIYHESTKSLTNLYDNIKALWDFIQVRSFFTCIDYHNIIEITREGFSLKINFDQNSSTDICSFINSKLIQLKETAPETVIIRDCREEFVNLFDNYYTFQKNH